MLIFDHQSVRFMLFPVLLLGLGPYLWVWGKRSNTRLLRVVAGSVTFASGLLLLGNGCVIATTKTVASGPLYSPDGRLAVIVRNWSTGGVGEHASEVALYSWGGIREQIVAEGHVWSFSTGQAKWLSNRELELSYSGRERPFCESTAQVRVTCPQVGP